MPCTSHIACSPDTHEKHQEELDELTALLCEAMTVIDHSDLVVSDAADEWWEEHKKLDAERKAQAQALEDEQRKQRAVTEAGIALRKIAELEEQLTGLGGGDGFQQRRAHVMRNIQRLKDKMTDT